MHILELRLLFYFDFLINTSVLLQVTADEEKEN